MNEENKKLKPGRVVSNYFYAYRLMIQLYRGKYIWKIILTVCNSFSIFLLYTYMIRFLVNGVQSGKSMKELLPPVIVMFFVVILISVLKQVYETILDPVLSKRSDVRFQKFLFTKSLNADLSDFEDPATYDLFNHAMTNGAEAIKKTMDFGSEILDSIMTFALTLCLFIAIDPWLFIFPLLVMIINVLNVRANDLWYRFERGEQQVDRKIDYVKRVFYLPNYAKEIRLSNIGNSMFGLFQKAVKDFLDMAKKEGPRRAMLGFGVSFGVDGIAGLGAELYALYRFLVSKTMLLGDCLVVLRSTTELSWAATRLGWMFADMYDIALHVQDYRLYMEKVPRIESGVGSEVTEAGDLSLHRVSFLYDGAEEESLHSISMTIHRGERVAIVGMNGSGKTTLVKLLMRLYDVSEGEIMLGNVNIRDFELLSYRAMYGVVFQDYQELTVSIAENVLGRPYVESDEERVIEALKKAGIWTVVNSLPNGIHTVVGREFDEDGALFSQGQLQKLAIATIYARNCEIVILDEPSSALDPIAEQKLFEELYRACEGKTMIFISHRMSSVVNADHIFVLDDGKLVEDGCHVELMKQNGIYAEMFRKQAESYLAEEECESDEE